MEPIIGRDLGPLLRREVERVYGPQDAIGYELAGHAALFQGGYKILYIYGPLGDGQWHLYNIVEDPGETRDLAAEEPERFQRMLSAYERYARDNKVLEVPPGYDHLTQVALNTLHKRLRTPALVAMLVVLVLLPFLVAFRIKSKEV